jgi:hypothetical protein
MVHLGFLPRNAAVIDINPPQSMQVWHGLVKRVVHTYSLANNLTFIPVDIASMDDAAAYPKHLRDDPLWKTLAPEKRLEILETLKCPKDLPANMNNRCWGKWLTRNLMGVLLDPQQTLEAVKKALQAVQAAGGGKNQTSAAAAAALL